MSRSWHVITGGPSSGKTTLLEHIEKLGFSIKPETARIVIDEGIAKGLSIEEIRQDERAFQDEILRRKLKLEASYDPSETIFLDRGMHDSIPYYEVSGFTLSPEQLKLITQANYGHVFLLNQLPHYEIDYARTEDANTAAVIHKLLDQTYREHGFNVVAVPVLRPKQRAQFILDYIETHK